MGGIYPCLIFKMFYFIGQSGWFLFIYLFIYNTLSKQWHPPKGGASNTKQQSYKVIKGTKIYTK